MMKDWKTTLGGALSALGTTLMGVGTVTALNGTNTKWIQGMMIGGFILSAFGKFFTALFTPDKTNGQS
jgi:hypothetical protein